MRGCEPGILEEPFGDGRIGEGPHSQAVQAGLENSLIVEKKAVLPNENLYRLQRDWGKIQYILGKSPAITLNTDYTERVVAEILIEKGQF